MTLNEALKNAVSRLGAADDGENFNQARILAQEIFGLHHAELITKGDMRLSDDEIAAFNKLIDRRITGEPLQYILGHWEFMGLDFICRPGVLIPRQDTETLVEEAMTVTLDGAKILDLCTGSGCVLLSLMNYKNNCEGIGVDISAQALTLAGDNAAHLEVKGAAFMQGDLYDKIEGKFDIIVSNPPYIESDAIDRLQTEIKDFEPRLALDGGKDGLDFYRRIIKEAPAHLHAGAYLMLEAGYGQALLIGELMKEYGFFDIRFIKDLQGIDRVVRGSCV